jgi:uncharacterized membrane protein
MSKKEGQNNHNHPALKDLPHDHLTRGQKAADRLTGFCGSWTFILALAILIVFWIYINVMMVIYKWDPYPFIVLNLVLSCVAAIEAPIILMSQNRTNERDRIQARYDYLINRKAAKEIEELHEKIDRMHATIAGLKSKKDNFK